MDDHLRPVGPPAETVALRCTLDRHSGLDLDGPGVGMYQEYFELSRLAQSIQCSARPKYPCLTTRPTRVSPAAQPRWTIPIKEGDGPVHPPHEKQGRAVEPQSRSLSSEWSAAERN